MAAKWSGLTQVLGRMDNSSQDILEALQHFLDGRWLESDFTRWCSANASAIQRMTSRGAYLRISHADRAEARRLLQSMAPCVSCSTLPWQGPSVGTDNFSARQDFIQKLAALDRAANDGLLLRQASTYQCLSCGAIRVVHLPERESCGEIVTVG